MSKIGISTPAAKRRARRRGIRARLISALDLASTRYTSDSDRSEHGSDELTGYWSDFAGSCEAVRFHAIGIPKLAAAINKDLQTSGGLSSTIPAGGNTTMQYSLVCPSENHELDRLDAADEEFFPVTAFSSASLGSLEAPLLEPGSHSNSSRAGDCIQQRSEVVLSDREVQPQSQIQGSDAFVRASTSEEGAGCSSRKNLQCSDAFARASSSLFAVGSEQEHGNDDGDPVKTLEALVIADMQGGRFDPIQFENAVLRFQASQCRTSSGSGSSSCDTAPHLHSARLQACTFQAGGSNSSSSRRDLVGSPYETGTDGKQDSEDSDSDLGIYMKCPNCGRFDYKGAQFCEDCNVAWSTEDSDRSSSLDDQEASPFASFCADVYKCVLPVEDFLIAPPLQHDRKQGMQREAATKSLLQKVRSMNTSNVRQVREFERYFDSQTWRDIEDYILGPLLALELLCDDAAGIDANSAGKLVQSCESLRVELERYSLVSRLQEMD